MEMKLEVIPIGVTDVDRAKKFYTEQFGREAKRELSEIHRVKKEIEIIQADVSNAAAVASDVASAAHSISFGAQASEHSKAAKWWLGGVGLAMLLSLTVALIVVLDIVKELRISQFHTDPEAAVLKITILAFAYLIIRFTTKNYSAHQHLYIVNRHRANVLQSMEAFRTSASDGPTKDAVLLAAVGAAYSQQETGFITTKEGAGADDTDLIKVVESAIKRQ